MNIENTLNSQLLQLVTFKIANEEFGVDVLHLQEIIRMMKIIRVPKTPPFVKGVINLRGKIIPVIDLREKFKLKDRNTDKYSRIIVTEAEHQILGFLVDSVSEVLRIPSEKVEPPPSYIAGINSAYIRGVIKMENRFLILLDLTKIVIKERTNIDQNELLVKA